MPQFPFTAIVGSDDMALALELTAVAPEIGGVLVRGEKGTAKSTMVRALADVLPEELFVTQCRFGCDPASIDPACPDGPHADAAAKLHRVPLVELPVGATEDRVVGSLDVQQVLAGGAAAFKPGLLAAAHRGILYVDEVNLLHDHLVDLLLDAAAMGRNTVERDGISESHSARIVLVGTMNPEEGELRPQLLDRFGLTVEAVASRDVAERTEVIRRRLAFDSDPAAFVAQYADTESELTSKIVAARELVKRIELSDWALTKISTVCAGFEVDGLRGDIVTARAAVAHAALRGSLQVQREDIRTAARLALPHRRRRNPFDAPGLDLDLLDALLGDDELPPEPEDEPPAGPDRPGEPSPNPQPEAEPRPADSAHSQEPQLQDRAEPSAEQMPDPTRAAPGGVAAAGQPFRAKALAVKGIGSGAPGRRSRAITNWGRTVDSRPGFGRLHLVASITAAAPQQRPGMPFKFRPDHLRQAVTQGKESNLILFAVDASGSMAARKRMTEVKTAVLSLLMDAYQRRDRVGLVTFRGGEAELVLPPTRSVEAAAMCLAELPHGGRTPLAEGLIEVAHTLAAERIKDPNQRALIVLITDGRATSGEQALQRAQAIGDAWAGQHVDTVVVDCESGRFRLGLAADLAARMAADYLPLSDVGASQLVDVVRAATNPQYARSA